MLLDGIVESIYKEVGKTLLKEALENLIGKEISIHIGDIKIHGKVNKKINNKYTVEIEIKKNGGDLHGT